MPVTGNSHDNEAIAAYQQAMPGYTIVPIMQSDYTPWLSTDALHCRTHELADLGMLYLKHFPLLGEVSLSDPLNISVTVKALSGANLITDSLLVYFRINHGDWNWYPLQNISDDEYAFTFTAINYLYQPGDTVEYYLYAKDESGRTEKYPYIGAADPFMFHFGGVGIEDRKPLQVRVWPNPASDFVIVQGENIENIVIYNTFGQLIDYVSVSGENNVKISCGQWAKGVYILNIQDNQGRMAVRKICR